MKRRRAAQVSEHARRAWMFRCQYDREYLHGPLPDADLGRHNPPRTKQTDPYAYDPYTIWGQPYPSDECNASDYTDHLCDWDYEKYDRLANKIYRSADAHPFADYGCRGDLIEKFLRAYHDNDSIKLLRVIAYCNAATGYPTWRLDYHYTPKSAPAP